MAYTIQVIARKANDLLRHCNIVNYPDDLPIDLIRIASTLNIQIFIDDFQDDSISGFLSLKNNHNEIVVNALHPMERQRFTIAHEIGHYILHAYTSDQVFMDEDRTYHRKKYGEDIPPNPIEIEANKFAAELLMPTPMIKQAIKEQQQLDWFIEGDDLVAVLAAKFQVSTIAMSIRLGSLVLR